MMAEFCSSVHCSVFSTFNDRCMLGTQSVFAECLKKISKYT